MLFKKTPVITDVQFMEFSFIKHSEISVAPRPFHSLSFRRSGHVEIVADGHDLVSEANSLTFVPRGLAYRTSIKEAGEMLFMHFNTLEDVEALPFSFVPPSPKRFENLFSEARGRAATLTDLIALSDAYKLLAETEKAMLPKDVYPPRRMVMAKSFIDENITDGRLRISEIAAMTGISEVYFRSEFRRYYSSSPLDYIKRRRIEIAKSILSTGLSTVAEAALSAGFESISYFSQEFSRMVGMSPSEYMKRRIER